MTMWNRYSGELDLRMKNRIDQITGAGAENGSANMVEDFLRNTYPRIISMMLTYKLVFEQIRVLYRKGVYPKVNQDDAELIAEAVNTTFDTQLLGLLVVYDATLSDDNETVNS